MILYKIRMWLILPRLSASGRYRFHRNHSWHFCCKVDHCLPTDVQDSASYAPIVCFQFCTAQEKTTWCSSFHQCMHKPSDIKMADLVTCMVSVRGNEAGGHLKIIILPCQLTCGNNICKQSYVRTSTLLTSIASVRVQATGGNADIIILPCRRPIIMGWNGIRVCCRHIYACSLSDASTYRWVCALSQLYENCDLQCFQLETHWGLDEMVDILQTTLWNAFSSTRICVTIPHIYMSNFVVLIIVEIITYWDNCGGVPINYHLVSAHYAIGKAMLLLCWRVGWMRSL